MYYIQNLFGHPVVINEWRLLIKRRIGNKATKKSQSQPKARHAGLANEVAFERRGCSVGLSIVCKARQLMIMITLMFIRAEKRSFQEFAA